MRIFISTFILLLVFQFCSTETFSMNGTDPQYPGMCVHDGIPYPPGEHKVKRRCVKIICGVNGWISGHSCIPQNKTGCRPGDLFAFASPFPECCKRFYSCVDDDGSPYEISDF